MSSDAVVIEAHALGKAYPHYPSPVRRLAQLLMPNLRVEVRQVLEDITFTLRKGETLAIVGRNGAGKSTLLQLICGTLMPSSGEVRSHGRVAALLELGAGFNPDFTGRENVYLNAALHGLSRRDVDARMASILAFADIGDYIDQPVRTYSSGMYVRLAFSAIAHVDADVLIIDEALAVGDAFFVQKCMRFLREFQTHGSLLFVSHDSSAVTALCDRAIWLDGGRIRMLDTAKRVCEAYLAEQFDATPTAPEISGEAFGVGGAQIRDVSLVDEQGAVVSTIQGGERVTLRARIAIAKDIVSPIVGFYVKDRLGQTLFGDNTWKRYEAAPLQFHDGQTVQAGFSFIMPRLQTGAYTVAVAIAEGTQVDHVQHHWIHDALVFHARQSDGGVGLVGIPMLSIELKAL